MAHARVKPAGWSINEKLTSAQANQIDINVSESLDKTSAGDTLSGNITFASTGKLTLNDTASEIELSAGASIEVDSAGEVNINSSGILQAKAGGVIKATGAAAKIKTESSGRFELGDNDFPTLGAGHTGASRTVRIPLGNLDRYSSSGAHTSGTIGSGDKYGIITSTLGILHVMLPPPHNGATLSTIKLWFKPASGHASLPTTSVRLLPFRFGAFTNNTAAPSQDDLAAAAAEHSLSGLVVADYNANMFSLSCTCTQNNVIDTSLYTYGVRITDENGGGAIAGCVYYAIDLSYTSIADLRFQ